MANFTGKAIKETFISLLEEKPLSEITVKDIVETCGINRNSFYYHFQGIPELLEDIIKEEAEEIIKKYPSANTIVECFDAMVEFTSHRKRAIMHIYSSINRDVFERHLMVVSEYLVRNYVNAVTAQEEISEVDRNTIVDYYKSVAFGLIINWLETGMNEDYIKSVRRIFLLKKDLALEIARQLQGQI